MKRNHPFKSSWVIPVMILAALFLVSQGNLFSLSSVGYPHAAPTSTSLVYSNHNWQVWKVVMPEEIKSIPYPEPVDFRFTSNDLAGGSCNDYGQSSEVCRIYYHVDTSKMGEFWVYKDGEHCGSSYASHRLTDHGVTTFYGKVYFLASWRGVNFSQSYGGGYSSYPYGQYLTYTYDKFTTHNTGVLVNSTPALGIHSNTFYIAVYITGRDSGRSDTVGSASWGVLNGPPNQGDAGVPRVFPFSEIYYVPEDINIPTEPVLINSSMSPFCPVPDGYALATQSFAGPTNLTIEDMRYPVNYFCESLPIIETSSETGLTSQLSAPYQQLLDGGVVHIPQGDTWTVFYGTEATADMNMICPDGSIYNASTNRCDVYPAVVHICSEGVLDPETGLCTVQPDTIIHCDYGEYDSNLKKCVYTPPTNVTCEQGEYDALTNQCEASADTVALCDKGYYDTVQQKCIYHPPLQADCPSGSLYNVDRDACEWTPDLRSICDNLGVFNPEHHICEVPPGIGKDCEYTCSVYDSSQNPSSFVVTKKAECIPDTYWKDKTGTEQERHETQTKMDCADYPTCSVGVYSEKYSMCVFPPNADTPYCDTGVWDQSLKRCTSNPSLSTQISSVFPSSISPYIKRTIGDIPTQTIQWVAMGIMIIVLGAIAHMRRWI